MLSPRVSRAMISNCVDKSPRGDSKEKEGVREGLYRFDLGPATLKAKAVVRQSPAVGSGSRWMVPRDKSGSNSTWRDLKCWLEFQLEDDLGRNFAAQPWTMAARAFDS